MRDLPVTCDDGLFDLADLRPLAAGLDRATAALGLAAIAAAILWPLARTALAWALP